MQAETNECTCWNKLSKACPTHGANQPLGVFTFSSRRKSEHQQCVENFMRLAGQEIPDKPAIPSEEVRLLRAKLILEEALETVQALGFNIKPWSNNRIATVSDFDFLDENTPDIQEVVDGCCDIKVVTTGTLSAFGIADEGPQEAVDKSNLDKFIPPVCESCKDRVTLELSDPESSIIGVSGWMCKSCNTMFALERLGGYKREDGKWVNPTTWKAPNWGVILSDQKYDLSEDEDEDDTSGVPIIDDSVVPLGPGDGLKRLPLTNTGGPSKKYVGHVCPICKEPVSDDVVKQLDERKRVLSQCPGCRAYFKLDTRVSIVQLAQCD